MAYLILLAGLLVLVLGAEALVRGASRLAAGLGITPLVIGLTVVAFGTSAPEMAVSIGAALTGQADIALGNVVGSNTFNILAILGISALVAPLAVAANLVKLDVPLMILAAIILLLMALDGRVSQLDGLILFAGVVVYTAGLIWLSKKETSDVSMTEITGGDVVAAGQSANTLANLAWIAGGLVLLVLGSRWLVDSAVQIAQTFGVSELVIGLTIVAAGTSMPELATSVVASIRGERDIAVGNVVGSNLFNILAVLGLSSMISPDGVDVAASALRLDIPVMIAASLVCLPIFFFAKRISRGVGALFLLSYVAYTVYLIMNTAPAL